MNSGHQQFRRIGSTGLALTAAAALVFPGSATATEQDSVAAGQCVDEAANKKHEADSSDPDGTTARTTDPDDTDSTDSTDSTASLSLTGTLDLRGFDALTGLLCNAKKGAVDALVRPVVEDDETTSPEMGDTPGSDSDENAPGNIPPASGTDAETPIGTPESLGKRTPTSAAPGTPPGTGADGGGWGGVSTGRAPGAIDVPPTSADDGSTFSAAPHDPRAAHDADSAKASERLPLLLAVLSLVLVSSALAHTWARRALLR